MGWQADHREVHRLLLIIATIAMVNWRSARALIRKPVVGGKDDRLVDRDFDRDP
ncbi:hypothetical protein [Roseateles sp.]|uniref:hypothetical protein n=1 Tax=Roseateles sp. TaxID=1971397 RepID=UPI0032634B2F